MTRVWTLEIDALDENDDPVTLRFSTHQLRQPDPYHVRLKQQAIFKVSASGGLIGRSESGYGEALLLNEDGGLDYLADYAIDGRTCRLTLISSDESFGESNFELLDVGGGDLLDVGGGDNLIVSANTVTAFLGTVKKAVWNDSEVAIYLRDGREALERTHPYSTYAGDNTLPAGVEGTAQDIKGLMKPVVYGAAVNVKPVLVNTSKYIYQIHEGGAFQVGAVYDQGVLLTEAASQPESSLVALEASSPAPGEYTWYAGFVRVGAIPSELTISGGRNDINTAGEVFEEIAGEAGYSVDASDVTALDALGVARIYMNSEMTTASMLDRIARSFGCWWTVLSNGEIRVRQIAEPEASPSITINHSDLVRKPIRSSTGAGENGLPVWRVTIEADPVEYVQSVFAATAPATRQARFQNRYRKVTYEDAAVLARHPLADELKIESDIRNLTEAQDVADHVGDLFGVRRDSTTIECHLSPNVISALEIGASLTLKTDYLGYSAGRNFLVLGHEIDGRKEMATLELWG